MTRRLTLTLFLLLLSALIPRPVHAAEVDTGARTARCDERARLAGIVEAEAYSQPAEAEIAIAQIVVAEADSRGMTVCALSERTWFVSVWHYAQAHPSSWHAARFAAPEDWSLILAGDVLAGALPDLTRGTMHFDGVPHEGDTFVVGQTHFRK